jgi:hypothetical protein
MLHMFNYYIEIGLYANLDLGNIDVLKLEIEWQLVL